MRIFSIALYSKKKRKQECGNSRKIIKMPVTILHKFAKGIEFLPMFCIVRVLIIEIPLN